MNHPHSGQHRLIKSAAALIAHVGSQKNHGLRIPSHHLPACKGNGRPIVQQPVELHQGSRLCDHRRLLNLNHRRSPAGSDNAGFHHHIILLPLAVLKTGLVHSRQNPLKRLLLADLLLIVSTDTLQGGSRVHNHVLKGRQLYLRPGLFPPNIGNHSGHQVRLIRPFTAGKEIVRHSQKLGHHFGVGCLSRSGLPSAHKYPHGRVQHCLHNLRHLHRNLVVLRQGWNQILLPFIQWKLPVIPGFQFPNSPGTFHRLFSLQHLERPVIRPGYGVTAVFQTDCGNHGHISRRNLIITKWDSRRA